MQHSLRNLSQTEGLNEVVLGYAQPDEPAHLPPVYSLVQYTVHIYRSPAL